METRRRMLQKRGVTRMADDPYRIADQVDASMLEIMVSRLEERGRDARFLGMIDDYLDAANISEANEVLDIGCGTGVVARRIASQLDFSGRVTGIDLSPQLIDKARELATSEGLSYKTTFAIGDIRNFVFEDSQFDVTIMHTLVSHLDDPAGALNEAVCSEMLLLSDSRSRQTGLLFGPCRHDRPDALEFRRVN